MHERFKEEFHKQDGGGYTANARTRCRAHRLLSTSVATFLLLLSGADAAQSDVTVRLEVQGAPPEFSRKHITVKPRQRVQLTLDNSRGHSPHNWALIKPGKVDEVIAFGLDSGRNPGGARLTPDILASTVTIEPGAEVTMSFLAPAEPGRYPFISSVGDDPKSLKGALVVKR